MSKKEVVIDIKKVLKNVDKIIDECVKVNKEEIEIQENEYQELFKKKLKDFGVSSPNELSDQKKKEFFDQVDKEWKSKKEK